MSLVTPDIGLVFWMVLVFGLLFGWLARWVIRNYIEKPAA